ncbi:MAG: DUF4418 family protein [Lachnospiraceae bacterium]|nr:DUF4418 family protein [Lachnospiraceae bacterium]
MKKKGDMIICIILLALSVFAAFGVRFFFHACLPKEDGSYMNCHNAELAVMVMFTLMAVVYALALLFKKYRGGLVLASIPMAIAACVIPQGVISMCMMRDMRCFAVMRPAVIACSAVMVIFSAVLLWSERRSGLKRED